eukprot:2321101-Rhodomonas_salina.1
MDDRTQRAVAGVSLSGTCLTQHDNMQDAWRVDCLMDCCSNDTRGSNDTDPTDVHAQAVLSGTLASCNAKY